MRPLQALLLWVRVDMGVMAIKRYSTLPRVSNLELLYQMQFSVPPKMFPFFFWWEVSVSSLQEIKFIGLVGRVLTNGPGDHSSIPGHVIPKTLKMVLDTSLLSTQQYKVHIKGKVEQSKESSSALPYTSV